MAHLENISNCRVNNNSIIPELEFDVNIKTWSKNFILQFINGILKTIDNKKIAEIQLISEKQRNSNQTNNYLQLTNYKEDKSNNQENNYFYFSALLTQKSIDYIEELRQKDPKKDVHFRMELSFYQTTVKQDNYEKPTSGLNCELKTMSNTFIIPASNWIAEFTEYLGIGKYLLLELNMPKNENIQIDEWKTPIERAYESLLRTENYIKQGEWYEAIKNSREVFEHFKFNYKNQEENKVREQLRNLFKDVNLTDEGFSELFTSIRNIYSYISSFIHEKNDKGEYIPKPIANKEDAYFIYTMSLNLTNLIAKKLSK